MYQALWMCGGYNDEQNPSLSHWETDLNEGILRRCVKLY